VRDSEECLKEGRFVVTSEEEILDAARNHSENLTELLQEKIETLNEEEATRLLDKVLLILKESLWDIRGWKM